jgi:hypothetical protein
MLIAALVVGLITAYHMGVKVGAYAAGVAGALFLLAMLAPDYAIPIYVSVCVGVIGVCFAGPKVSAKLGIKQPDSVRAMQWTRKQVGRVTDLWKRL